MVKLGIVSWRQKIIHVRAREAVINIIYNNFNDIIEIYNVLLVMKDEGPYPLFSR